jgi:hypothetical protein
MRRAEPVAGLGGALLLVSLFLTWYDVVLAETRGAAGTVTTAGLEYSGWAAFGVIDVLLAIIALIAIAVPLVSVASKSPATSIGFEVIATIATGLGILLIAFRLLFPPADALDPAVGAWLGLAGALIACVGAWFSMRDESTPGAVAPDVPRRPAPS